MAELEALLESGLTGAEAKVYLALLELGSVTAGPVIKKSGLHRATAYQVLQRLQEKGLASTVIKGNKKFFEAASPKRLADSLHEKENALAEVLPKLERMREAGREMEEVVVYSGVKGVKTALDSALAEIGRGGEYLDFGVSGMFLDVMGSYWHAWQRRKREMCVHSRVIFDEGVKKRNPTVLKEYFGVGRFHPKEYASLTDTMIYSDTVVLLIWSAKPPIAVVIKNAANAKSYRNQFEMMWKSASR